MKIDKNIPIPSHNSRRSYPFRDMAVGDSFAVPYERRETARQSAYRYAKMHGVRFVGRVEGNNFRIWRVE